MESLIQTVFLTSLITSISAGAYHIFYVLPDNSTNTNCPFQPCATLSQYLLDNNGSLPVVSNVEYHFLPGEHHIPASMTLQYLHNFIMLGSKQYFSISTIFINGLQSYLKVFDSVNVTIKNVIFKRPQMGSYLYRNDKFDLYNLAFKNCSSSTIMAVEFLEYGFAGDNLLGEVYLSDMLVNLSSFPICCFYAINLWYMCDYRTEYNGDCKIIINNVSMSSGNASDIIPRTGISITFKSSKAAAKTTAIIKNSFFHNMDQTTILSISTLLGCGFTIITQIENCTFSNNKYSVTSTEPMVEVSVPYINVALTFLNCIFLSNNYLSELLSISLSEIGCDIDIATDALCAYSSRITIRDCLFSNNTAALLKFYGSTLVSCVNIHITGTVNITRNSITSQSKNIMYFRNSVAHISGIIYLSQNYHQYTMFLMYSSYISFNGPFSISNNTADVIFAFEHSYIVLNGPITISENHGSIMQTYLSDMIFNGPIVYSMNEKCKYIMLFQYSDVLFNETILFQSNLCHQIVNIKSDKEAYIKIMEYSNITFSQNTYSDLIAVETEDDNYNIYPYCLFQYVVAQNASATAPSHYAIVISDSFIYKCKLSFYHFTSHCKWMPTSAFKGRNPSVINQQIIHANFKISHFTILYCANITRDTLGLVYPGQKLQVELCMPCSDNNSILYVETYNSFLPKSACKIAHQTELINVIVKNSTIINYTIVSEVNESCELFLTVSPFLYYIYEVFDVQLLPCPIGFTLQNGVCDCDPLLPTDIDTCYIDQSAIRRPANTWISYTQSGTSKYLISDCPLDYCLPFSSSVNLLHPDSQCQFNRTGILCSQCQHHLSMIFGSSRCMKCTNVHILITIIVIVAGIILVLLLYLLNLTVTKATINGIILYANIISINDSSFLLNGKVFDPLRIFISFVNLDLGIETCF